MTFSLPWHTTFIRRTQYSSIRGVNYVPATAANDIETWRDYNRTTIEHDLALAKKIGKTRGAARVLLIQSSALPRIQAMPLNTFPQLPTSFFYLAGANFIRVFLSYTVWAAQPSAFLSNVAHFVASAHALNMSVMPVPFDLCWFGCRSDTLNISLDSNCWLPSPQFSMADNRSWWNDSTIGARAYVRALTQQLPAGTPGLMLWDVVNEPESGGPSGLPGEQGVRWTFVRAMLALFAEFTTTPRTIGVANVASLSVIGSDVDVLSFHSYHHSWEQGLQNTMLGLNFSRTLNKPVFNSETGCIARANAYDQTIELAAECVRCQPPVFSYIRQMVAKTPCDLSLHISFFPIPGYQSRALEWLCGSCLFQTARTAVIRGAGSMACCIVTAAHAIQQESWRCRGFFSSATWTLWLCRDPMWKVWWTASLKVQRNGCRITPQLILMRECSFWTVWPTRPRRPAASRWPCRHRLWSDGWQRRVIVPGLEQS